MNWTKKVLAFSIVFFLSLLLLKGFDLAVGYVLSSDDPTKMKVQMEPRTIALGENNPNLDIKVMPDNRYMEQRQGLEQKEYRLRTNNQGFIIGERDTVKKSNAVDIIFFGGSTTECIYVEEDKRFPYLVADKLEKKDGLLLQTLNGGVSGNNTVNSLLNSIVKGLEIKPKFMVLMHAVNDVVLISKAQTYWRGPQSKVFINEGKIIKDPKFIYLLFKQVKEILIPNIWLRIRHVVASKIDDASNADEWASIRNKPKANYSDVEQALTEDFSSALKSFVAVSRAWGIEPILMTQFNRILINDSFIRTTYEQKSQPLSYDEFVKLYSVANELIRKIAKDEQVFLIDLDKELTGDNTYIYDAVHLNTQGSIVVAEYIANEMAKKYPEFYRLN
jgi:lysophospholipase L1-like esterase